MRAALGTQRELRIPHIVMFGLPGFILFSSLFHIRHDFQKRRVTEYKMCFDFLNKFHLDMLT